MVGIDSSRNFDNFPEDHEHPENDLSDDADYANRRPAPRDFDELADLEDPVKQQQRNRASTRQALWYLVASVVVTFGASFLMLMIFRLLGGPHCTSGEATWLCTDSAEIIWASVASALPVLFLIGCGIIMVRKLNAYLRWRPWMGVFWFLVPYTMAWLLITIQFVAV